MLKTIIIYLIFCFAALASDKNDRFSKLEDLERRIATLEGKIDNSLKDCQLEFKGTGIYRNRCPKNTVATEVLPLTEQVLQLRCGYFELICTKL